MVSLGRSLIKHVQCRRDLVQRTRQDFLLPAERRGESVQLVDGRDDVVALLIQACRRRCPAERSDRARRPARPDNAALKLWMMSPIWPSPPPLTTAASDDSVCSVDG